MGSKFFAEKIIYLSAQSDGSDNGRISVDGQWWPSAARRCQPTQQTDNESSVNERGFSSSRLRRQVLIHIQDNLNASDCLQKVSFKPN
jgi:hypothetical protein